MKSIRRAVEKLAHVLALVGFSGLLVLSIMVAMDIILRAAIDFPLKGVNDVAAIVMAVVITACIPKSLLMKQHLSIEVLGQSLGARMRAALETFASFAVLVFFVLMVWQFIPYTISIVKSGQTTWVLKLPVGPGWWVATGFLVVAVLAQAAILMTDLAFLFGKDVERTQASDGEVL